MTKKRICGIVLIIAICIISVFSLVACNAPNKVQGKYVYENSIDSYIQVNASTCDCVKVYIGDLYYDTGEYIGAISYTESKIPYEAVEVKAGEYKITAKKEYKNGKITITAKWYENGGNPQIVTSGRKYNKK